MLKTFRWLRITIRMNPNSFSSPISLILRLRLPHCPHLIRLSSSFFCLSDHTFVPALELWHLLFPLPKMLFLQDLCTAGSSSFRPPLNYPLLEEASLELPRPSLLHSVLKNLIALSYLIFPFSLDFCFTNQNKNSERARTS